MSQCPLWPLDPWCLPDDWNPDNLTGPQRAALEIASDLLKAATGYWYGPCLITVRPCSPERANPCTGPCGCHPVCRVMLPGPVTPGKGVAGVTVDGQPLPPWAWRVDNHGFLVRQDGQCFPACQRLDLPAGQPGTWSVTYWRGMPVPAAGARAVTALAVRILAECADGTGCWVDPRVTQLSRNGVVYNMDPDSEQAAVWLGLPVVRSWLATVNPKQLGGPLVFWTPEMGYNTTTTATGLPLRVGVVPQRVLPGQPVTVVVSNEAGTVLIDWGNGELTT